MRTLSSALQAAQKAASREPVVKCVVADAPVELPRMRFSPLYPGGEASPYCSAAVASDGSFTRIRSDAAGNLYRQRVTDPMQSSQWSSWTLGATGVSTAGQVAAARGSASGVVRIYAVFGAAGSRTVQCAESADNGATFGSWSVVATPPAGSEVRSLGASDDFVLYSVDALGANPDDYLCVVQKSGGSWGTPVADATLYSTISTAALAKEGTYLRVAFYCEGTLELRQKAYDLGGTGWVEGGVLLAAGSGSGYSYLFPWIVVPDADGPRYIYLWREYYNGSPVHFRRILACTPSRDYVADWTPLNVQGFYDVCLLKTGGYWYLLASGEAYRAPVYNPASTADKKDISADVAAFEITEPGEMGGSDVTLFLDNTDGRYGQVGTVGTAYEALAEGSQLALAQGYRTTAGEEYVWGAPWWVDRVSFEDGDGVGRLRAECVDAWEYLDRFRVLRQEAFTNQTLGTILQKIWWRVCGETTVPTTDGLATAVPSFTFQPGESYGDIARRICRRAGVAPRFGSDQTSYVGFGSVKPVIVAIGGGSSQYAYGPAAHPIRRASHRKWGQVYNHVELQGEGCFGEALDWARLAEVPRDVAQKVVDKGMDTNAEAAAMAGYILRWAKLAASGGYLEVAANVGQELWDVIAVTDSRANLSSALRRVVSLRTVYDKAKGRYDQRIGLSAV